MVNYNYQNLSDTDFESLSKDLLEKELKLKLERFATGKDGGVDLRYARNKRDKIVVQCKHYKDARSLISNLKKEAKKVKALKPKRYIVATSVSLTKKNKESIKGIFSPYIKKTTDIIGKQDFDDLLKAHSDVETQHYKLWLSSSNILSRILNSKVHNETGFLLEDIREKINIYVQNESFNEALNILKDKNFVVISGIPGIGKSTLAYIISYYLLGEGFEELVFMSDSVDAGMQHYTKGKKQIFLFDDFLGKSLLENKLATNEEQKIINFIRLISKSKDKVLIITTREYVLNQAREEFEQFSQFDWKKSKCIIDLSKYTKLIRAKILYNHLYFSDISKAHILNLLEKRNYLKIIDHKNYSPRVIEQVVLNGKWKEIDSKDFFTALNNYLNNPDLVWDHTFKVNIGEIGRITLLVLLSLGEPVFEKDLYTAVKKHVETIETGEAFSEIIFKRTLKELEDTFISINKDAKDQILIKFQNPSIQDFLTNFLVQNSSYKQNLITGAYFYNQLFTIFSFDTETKGKIFIAREDLPLVVRKLSSDFNAMTRSNLIEVTEKNKKSYWIKRTDSEFYKILLILESQTLSADKQLETLIRKKIENFDFKNMLNEDLSYFRSLSYRTKIKPKHLQVFFTQIPTKLHWVSEVKSFYEVAALYEKESTAVIDKEQMENVVRDVVNTEIQVALPYDYASLLDEIQALKVNYQCKLEEEIDELERNIHQYQSYEDSRWGDVDISDLPGYEPQGSDNESEVVDMFESLR